MAATEVQLEGGRFVRIWRRGFVGRKGACGEYVMRISEVVRLAGLTGRVHVRSAGKPEHAATSAAESYPILRIREGCGFALPAPGKPATPEVVADAWAGPAEVLQHLVAKAKGTAGAPLAEGLFCGEGNDKGLMLRPGEMCQWDRKGKGPDDIEVYLGPLPAGTPAREPVSDAAAQVAARRVIALWENERWIPAKGWGPATLPTDPHPWCDDDGHKMPPESVQPPASGDRPRSDSEWCSEWEPIRNQDTDALGWEYATGFLMGRGWYPQPKGHHHVRRRRWRRHYRISPAALGLPPEIASPARNTSSGSNVSPATSVQRSDSDGLAAELGFVNISSPEARAAPPPVQSVQSAHRQRMATEQLTSPDGDPVAICTTWENQRWFIVKGWSPPGALDRPNWSTHDGQIELTKEMFAVPSVGTHPPEECEWAGDWHVVVTAATDEEGWRFASNFPNFDGDGRTEGTGGSRRHGTVRRRRWAREARVKDQFRVRRERQPRRVQGLCAAEAQLAGGAVAISRPFAASGRLAAKLGKVTFSVHTAAAGLHTVLASYSAKCGHRVRWSVNGTAAQEASWPGTPKDELTTASTLLTLPRGASAVSVEVLGLEDLPEPVGRWQLTGDEDEVVQYSITRGPTGFFFEQTLPTRARGDLRRAAGQGPGGAAAQWAVDLEDGVLWLTLREGAEDAADTMESVFEIRETGELVRGCATRIRGGEAGRKEPAEAQPADGNVMLDTIQLTPPVRGVAPLTAGGKAAHCVCCRVFCGEGGLCRVKVGVDPLATQREEEEPALTFDAYREPAEGLDRWEVLRLAGPPQQGWQVVLPPGAERPAAAAPTVAEFWARRCDPALVRRAGPDCKRTTVWVRRKAAKDAGPGTVLSKEPACPEGWVDTACIVTADAELSRMPGWVAEPGHGRRRCASGYRAGSSTPPREHLPRGFPRNRSGECSVLDRSVLAASGILPTGGGGAAQPPERVPSQGVVQLTVRHATIASGASGDFYVHVSYVHPAAEQEHITAHRRGPVPSWDETIRLHIPDDRVPVRVEVWQQPQFSGSHHRIGEACLALGKCSSFAKCATVEGSAHEICTDKSLALYGNPGQPSLGRIFVAWDFKIEGPTEDQATDSPEAAQSRSSAPSRTRREGCAEEREGCIVFTKMRGRKLLKQDMFASDPFLRVQWRGLCGADYDEQTPHVTRSLNPEWKGATLSMPVERRDTPVRVSCWDWDKVGENKPLGEFMFTLRGRADTGSDWFSLQPRRGETNRAVLGSQGKLGEIGLTWAFESSGATAYNSDSSD
eukprot:TRINITY_DN70145_c0_g1_i1.p1 TRINITY_DN70145_c0_g1~~TRINITY_DN70145_c0_g1_i1.p1  ORF type:complete len:1317 (+),score=299.08 TRINITY_DN70145_c0_g1_i1:100-3951(+)